VREEIEHVREGQHGARSPKQIIAIGLSGPGLICLHQNREQLPVRVGKSRRRTTKRGNRRRVQNRLRNGLGRLDRRSFMKAGLSQRLIQAGPVGR
jgi:hypothetical protein